MCNDKQVIFFILFGMFLTTVPLTVYLNSFLHISTSTSNVNVLDKVRISLDYFSALTFSSVVICVITASHPFVDVDDFVAVGTAMLHVFTGVEAERNTAAQPASADVNRSFNLCVLCSICLFLMVFFITMFNIQPVFTQTG